MHVHLHASVMLQTALLLCPVEILSCSREIIIYISCRQALLMVHEDKVR